jgi:UDP-N-acetylglucosamine 2-epimerase (non-hydrolysing)
MKLVLVAGARPNFMKIAPLMWEVGRRPRATGFLVHTGQHYDEKMSKLFFDQLKIPKPDVDLEVGSGSHAVQTAEVMKRFEPVLLAQRPDAVIVVGDVNSTIACALTAVKLGIPVAHVEAGLRSRDWTMPEEINRVLTDSISRWLFVSEPSGIENLRREGVAASRIHHVGNVMIDTLVACRNQFEQPDLLSQFGVDPAGYAVLTMHRPANVDDSTTLRALLGALEIIQREIPVVFPVHPRTRKALLGERLDLPNVRLTDPLGYIEFMNLVAQARFVMTDSGGIQEETTYLGVPCLTLRNNTERPATIETGSNVLVGLDPEKIIAQARLAITGRPRDRRVPEFWDGMASRRILDILLNGGSTGGVMGAG